MKTRAMVCGFVLVVLPHSSLGQEKSTPTKSPFEQGLAETEREFGPARCDGLGRTAGPVLEGICRQYSSPSDRSAFFTHLEGCKKDFPSDQDLWGYCIRKAEIDQDLLEYCSVKVSKEAGLPTKVEGRLADAWWSLVNECWRQMWAKLIATQPLRGLADKAEAARRAPSEGPK